MQRFKSAQDYIGNDSRPLVVVLTGAGISQESGIPTFRDANGLWENHNIMEVASPEGFARDPKLVLRFYNLRRAACADVQPNAGHRALVELEDDFNVVVITQNVDDLHERAGSGKVLHLHGMLRYARSSVDENLIYDIGNKPIEIGDTCEKGSQLRPHIVWFGEAVPNIPIAAEIVMQADYLLIVGTSLVVYPAAGLADYAKDDAKLYVVNPDCSGASHYRHATMIEKKAGEGLPEVVSELKSQLRN
ncbi:MAG: SIR2 family NAD-dependent protein deacylase [Bacteroidota bacterium]